jgi:hypothetical protein
MPSVEYKNSSGLPAQIQIANPSISDYLLTSPQALRIAGGTIALDGSNPTPIPTGLNSIVALALTLEGNAAPGDNTSVLTYMPCQAPPSTPTHGRTHQAATPL